MKQRNIDSIIIKLIEDNISDEETEFLIKWMENEKNKIYFDEFIEINYLINAKNSFDYKTSLQKVKELIKRNSWNKRLSLLKYAAVFIAFIGTGYFFMNQNRTSNVSGNQLIIADDNITLELENGDVKVINSNGAQKLINISGKIVAEQIGNMLNYEKGNNSEELAYNILTIPNGKNFQLVLADGTKVHLNAGSSFKYPEKFINSRNREVYLLGGEAYFDVAKDPKHPFIVNADGINVRALGTEFNVSTYPEDSSINTVLVEGSVSVFGKDKTYDKATSLELKPGYKASWNKTKNNISVEEVDTDIYTGWKTGKLIFKNIQFKNIIKKLERHYNVTIINNNSKLGEKNYDATFDEETIEEVLNSFKKNYEMEYTIENNKIIIN